MNVAGEAAGHDVVTSLEQLAALYPAPAATSVQKVTTRLTPLQRRYVEASPFVVVATVGPNGVDCSPRGDPPGFVRVVHDRLLQFPDRRGNNRIDTLRNIVVDGRIALLFVVPGLGVTLRVNGTAYVRTDARLRASFSYGDATPTTVVEVAVAEVYTQCPKAFVRGAVWDPHSFRSPDDLPTVGQIMVEITDGAFDGEAHDAADPERLRTTLY